MQTKSIILVLLLASSPWAEAQLGARLDSLARMQTEAATLVIAPRVELEPISLREVYERVGEGTPEGAADVRESSFEREAVLWTACVRKKKEIEHLSASYELLAPSGERDRLAHADTNGGELRVTVTPLRPRALGKCPSDRGRWLYEGSVRILIDASAIQHAGRYAGTLIVVLNSL